MKLATTLATACLVAAGSPLAAQLPRVSVDLTYGLGGHSEVAGNTWYRGEENNHPRAALNASVWRTGRVAAVVGTEYTGRFLSGDYTSDCPTSPNGTCRKIFPARDRPGHHRRHSGQARSSADSRRRIRQGGRSALERAGRGPRGGSGVARRNRRGGEVCMAQWSGRSADRVLAQERGPAAEDVKHGCCGSDAANYVLLTRRRGDAENNRYTHESVGRHWIPFRK